MLDNQMGGGDIMKSQLNRAKLPKGSDAKLKGL